MTSHPQPATQHQIATLAGGCFWCLEAVFEQLRGVQSVTSGYTGGHLPNPTYEQVCAGTTGHAEAVQVAFDPTVVSYRDLLAVFFATHDPTTLNRQGPDVGTQYRSAIYYHTSAQQADAQAVIEDLTRKQLWPHPIVTEVAPAQAFYPAEEYHRQYYRRNPYTAYCQVVISPKLAKFRKEYLDKLAS